MGRSKAVRHKIWEGKKRRMARNRHYHQWSQAILQLRFVNERPVIGNKYCDTGEIVWAA